jgi:ParB-like chromosome segregation protein Spo0J
MQVIERVAIDSLVPHPRNPRQGDVGAISESLRIHGQYRPIVVQTSTRYILAGNHTWKAAKALHWPEVNAVFHDCTDDEAYRILLVDNRSGDLADYDSPSLAELLQELAATPLQLEGTGYDGDALDELLKDIVVPFPDLPNGDKAPFQQMTFTLHDEQAEQVDAALAIARKMGPFVDSPNENSNGNALARVCETFTTDHGGDV